MLNASKTIAAISTAPGAGGIGVVRISGPVALEIGQKISSSKLLPRIANFHSFKDLNGSLIDQELTTACAIQARQILTLAAAGEKVNHA